MQSNSKGDVELSVTLDTSGVQKETDKIKKEIEKGLSNAKTQDIKPPKIEPEVSTQKAEQELKNLDSSVQSVGDSFDEALKKWEEWAELSSKASNTDEEIERIKELSKTIQNLSEQQKDAFDKWNMSRILGGLDTNKLESVKKQFEGIPEAVSDSLPTTLDGIKEMWQEIYKNENLTREQEKTVQGLVTNVHKLSKEEQKAFDDWNFDLIKARHNTENLKDETGEFVIERPGEFEFTGDKTVYEKEAKAIAEAFGEEVLEQYRGIVGTKGRDAGMEFLKQFKESVTQQSEEVQKEIEKVPLKYKIDTPEENISFTKQLQQLTAEAKRAKAELDKLNSGFKYTNEYQENVKDVANLKAQLLQANEQLVQMRVEGQENTQEYNELVKKINSLGDELFEALKVQQEITDDGRKFTLGVDEEQIAQASKRYDTLIQKIALFRQNIKMGGDAWKQLTPNEKFSQFIYQLKTQYKELGDAILKKAVPAIQKFASNMAKFASGAIKGGIANLTASFKKLTPQINASNNSISNGIKQLLRYALGIGSIMILFNKLRGAVAEGIHNLVQWEDKTGDVGAEVAEGLPESLQKFVGSFKDLTNEVNGNLSVFISLLLQLKNQLAAAFAPIINIVVPILSVFVDSLIEATNYFAQFIAKVTGQDTWIKATRVQKNYADSLKGTGKSAKDASGALARFDDLDVLSKKAGGVDSIDPNDMFEEMPIEQVEENVEGWVEKLKIAWENSDFTDIGNAIGENLKLALDKIPWFDIQKKARKLAHSLATLLNGFFETEGLGKSIGRTIAEALNTVFIFLNEFVHTLHWDSIGQFIGEMLISGLRNFKWDEAGEALGGLLRGMISIAYNAVTTFTEQHGWDFLTNGILSAITSFVDELNRIDPNTGLTGWEEFGATLYQTINGILTTLTDLVDNLPIEDVMNGIAQVGEKAQVSDLVKKFFGLAEAIVQAISRALKMVDADMLGEALGNVLNGIIDLGDDLLALAGVVLEKLAEALKSGYSTLSSEHPLVVALGIAIGAALLALKTGIIPAAGVANVATVLSGLLGTLTVGVTKIILIVAAWEFGLNVGKALSNALFPDNKPFVEITAKDIFGSPVDLLKGIGLWFKDIAEGIWETAIQPLWTLITGLPTLLIEGLINGFNKHTIYTAFGPLIDLCNGIILWIKDIFGIHSPSTVMYDIAVNIIEGLIGGFEAVIGKVGEIWERIKTAIFEKVTLIKDSVMTKVDAFKLLFLGAFVEIQSKFISIWNKIKDGIKAPINAIIGLIEGMVNKIIDGLNGLIEKANGFSKKFSFKNPFSGKETKLELNLESLNHISIPRLAQGAVIPPNREFMAVLGDQRQGTNIEAPLDTITEAFADVVGSMRNTGNAVMQLDGQTFARLVVPYVMGELDRRGYNVKVLEG